MPGVDVVGWHGLVFIVVVGILVFAGLVWLFTVRRFNRIGHDLLSSSTSSLPRQTAEDQVTDGDVPYYTEL